MALSLTIQVIFSHGISHVGKSFQSSCTNHWLAVKVSFGDVHLFLASSDVVRQGVDLDLLLVFESSRAYHHPLSPFPSLVALLDAPQDSNTSIAHHPLLFPSTSLLLDLCFLTLYVTLR